MTAEKTYKQVPLIKDNMLCPICHKHITNKKSAQILLYKSPNKTKIINKQMLYCDYCDTTFVTSEECRKIKYENCGFWVAVFQPKKNVNIDYVNKMINRYYQPQYEPSYETFNFEEQTDKSIRIGDKDFELYPISKSNINKIVKNVYIIPVGFTSCPFCGKKLIGNYVYAIRINDTKCIKTIGYACNNCDAFFTISQNLFLDLEKIRYTENSYTLHTVFYNCLNYKSYNNSFNEIKSAYKQIVLCSNKNIKVFTLVYNPKDENRKEGIIHYSNSFATNLLSAEKSNNYIETNNEFFRIVRTKEKFSDKDLKKQHLITKIPELSSQNTLYIYDGNIACFTKHHTDEVRAVLYDVDKGDLSFYATYCYNCNKYLIKYDDYQDYLKKHGFFPLKLTLINMKYDDYFRAEKSPLLLNGYTVSETVGYSAQKRHHILKVIIESGILSKRKVLDYLEQFIRESTNNPYRQNAVYKWKSDRDFVLDYSFDETPKIRVWKIERRKH